MEAAQEVWISVEVYGPQQEIDRFKDMCFVAAPSQGSGSGFDLDFSEVISEPFGTIDIDGVQYLTSSTDLTAWNVRVRERQQRGTFRFAYDTSPRFPTRLFDRLAEMFPKLAFHCDCIGSMDEFMGFGWYNGPEGGEPLDFYDVPPDYWATGGAKRDAEAEVRHQARVDRIARAAREASS